MSRYELHVFTEPQLPFIFRHSKITPTHSGGTNWHENLEIIQADSGVGGVFCDGNKIALEAGRFAVISANALHDVWGDTVFRYHYLIIDRSFCIANGFDTATLNFPHTAIEDKTLSACFENLKHEYENDNAEPFRIPTIRANILSAVAHLCRSYSTADDRHGDGKMLSAVRQIIGRIRTDYADPNLSPVELSEFAGISHSYLAHGFKRVTGYTCAGFINLTRCERAKELLADGNFDTCEVARRCGFASHSYFTRVFHSVVGISPTSYRSSCKKD